MAEVIYWYAKVGVMSEIVIVEQRAQLNGTFMHWGKYMIGKRPQIKALLTEK